MQVTSPSDTCTLGHSLEHVKHLTLTCRHPRGAGEDPSVVGPRRSPLAESRNQPIGQANLAGRLILWFPSRLRCNAADARVEVNVIPRQVGDFLLAKPTCTEELKTNLFLWFSRRPHLEDLLLGVGLGRAPFATWDLLLLKHVGDVDFVLLEKSS